MRFDPQVHAPAADLVRSWVTEARERLDGNAPSDQQQSDLDRLVEELEVAAEELRAQNEALVEAASRAEVERNRFEELFNSAPDAYVVSDQHGLIRNANSAAGHLFGMAPGWLPGKPLAIFIEEGQRSSFRANLSRIARLEQVSEWVVEVSSRGGRVTPVAVSASAVAGDEDDSIEIRWLLRDVSDRKRAEEEARMAKWEHAARVASEAAEWRANFLADAAQRLNDVVGIMPRVQCTADLGVAMGCDYAIVDLLDGGHICRHAVAHGDPTKAELMLRLLEFPPHPDGPEGVARVLRSGRAEVEEPGCNASDDGHRELLDALGARLELHLPLTAREATFGVLTVGVVTTEPWDGNLLMFAQAFADRAAAAIDNARMIHEMMLARDDARSANEAKARFLGTLSHEFRTPLTAVIGYSELLLSGVPEALPPTLRQYVERIRASCSHQLNLVEEILEFARLEAGSHQPNRLPIDLRDVVKAAADLVRPEATAAGLQLEVIVPDHAIVGSTDLSKLRQILVNLLANAVHYTEQGRITAQLTQEDGAAVVQVSDTGVGISRDDLDRIFDRFWRAGSGIERRADGAGLGLSITRSLVQLLGGTIDVESKPGVGSSFTIRIPTAAQSGVPSA